MRYTQNIVFSVLLTFSLLLLAGCTGTGRNLPDWDYGAKTEKTAEAKPSSIVVDGNIGKPSFGAPVVAAMKKIDYPPIKVGVLLPLSGSHAELGNSMLRAAQMALFDVAHLSFELLPYDTLGTSAGAKAAAQKAASNGVTLVLGPVFADSVRAAKSVTRANNINMIAFSTDWSVTDSNVFTMGFLPFDQVERIVSYAARKNLQRIGVIAPQTTYGRAIVSAYKTLAQQHGIDTVDILSYTPQSANLSPEVRKFAQYDARVAQAEALAVDFEGQRNHLKVIERKKAGLDLPFDAVLIAAGGQDAITISNLLSTFDLTPRAVKRLGIGLFDDPALASEVALRNAWFAAPSLQSRDSFDQRFQAVYGETPLRLASLAYDATALAAVLAQRGLESTGVPDFNRVAITNPNGFAGIDGIFRFLDNGTVERGLSVLTFDRGMMMEADPAPRTFQESRR